MPDPVRVAFFGNGFTRKVILPCLRPLEGIELVGISSPNLERLRETAAEFGIPLAATEHREILQRGRPDLVFVVTPPHRHAEMALDALDAGCHVVCEKPMALDARESARMLAAARARPPRLTLIDHELRFHPGRIALRELVGSGRLGTIRHASYTLHSSGRRDSSLPWTWWSDAAQGGGVLAAIGSHAIDALRLLLGEITEVRGRLQTFTRERHDRATGRPRPVSSDELAAAWLRFRSGATATLLLSTVEGDRLHRITLAGSDGAAWLDEQGPLRLSLGDGAIEERPIGWGLPPCSEIGIPETDWASSFLIFARRIVEALRQGRTTVPGAATFADGHRTQLVLDAIRRSSESAGWVAVGEGGKPIDQDLTEGGPQ